jgi:diguanylate cyclase (GGDEF)-like protein
MSRSNPANGEILIAEERISYLEEANRTYVSILDMLSSDDFQAELTRGNSPEDVFRATLSQVKRLLPFQGVGILENLEDSSFAMALSEPHSLRDELLVDVDVLIKDGTFFWALSRNQSILVPSASGGYSILLHVIATRDRIRGMFIGRLFNDQNTLDPPSLNALSITLRSAAHAVESITLYAMLREHLHTLELTVQERTAELEKTALELKRSNEKLEALSNTDHLTHIYNRRFLMEELDREMLRARRNRTSLSLIILDIDHFKSVNDTYGHQNGDLVIIAVAEIIQKRMRCHDMVARYGGEEFVVVLPETSLCDAVQIAERLRNSVREISFPSPMENLKIRISLGVATFPSDSIDGPDSLIRYADEALYHAKSMGRDRVEVMEFPCRGAAKQG